MVGSTGKISRSCVHTLDSGDLSKSIPGSGSRRVQEPASVNLSDDRCTVGILLSRWHKSSPLLSLVSFALTLFSLQRRRRGEKLRGSCLSSFSPSFSPSYNSYLWILRRRTRRTRGRGFSPRWTPSSLMLSRILAIGSPVRVLHSNSDVLSMDFLLRVWILSDLIRPLL